MRTPTTGSRSRTVRARVLARRNEDGLFLSGSLLVSTAYLRPLRTLALGARMHERPSLPGPNIPEQAAAAPAREPQSRRAGSEPSAADGDSNTASPTLGAQTVLPHPARCPKQVIKAPRPYRAR